MINSVLCTAPFTAILVDTNKGVRPCCAYDNKYLGNIKDQSVVSIINTKEWKNLKQQMRDHTWPAPCLNCKEREEVSNWSVRKLFLEGNFDVTGWESENLTYLEFNGSNICNLACLHCNAGFSSRWVKDVAKAKKVWSLYDEDKRVRMKWMDAVINYEDDTAGRSTRMHLPDPDLILKNLKELNLTYLRTINFKGGEPFLNEETYTILDHLDKLGLLSNIKVIFSSNGTYMNDDYIRLLSKCNKVVVNISVDGTYELFNYIRHGDAKFEDLEPTIAKLNTVPNISIEMQTAVMNYNIYNLIDIRNWAIEMSKKYNKVLPYSGFSNCVQHPRYLSLNTLSDDTRKTLFDFYSKNPVIYKEFDQVVSALQHSYLGDDMHNNWVDFTNMMQTVRNNNILDIVPQLENELKYV